MAKVVDEEGRPVLPASIEYVDSALVERAAHEIGEILRRTVNRGMEEIGRYLLREFYDDDPELYFSMHVSKHASLSRLAERCETMGLPIRRTFLGNALRIAAVAKRLPRDSRFHDLPPSHRVEIVRVRKPEQIEAIAAKVADKSLSLMKTRTLVRKVAERHKSTVGRKPIPPIIRAITACERLLTDRETGKPAFGRAEAKALTEAQRQTARDALRRVELRVAELRRVLGS